MICQVEINKSEFSSLLRSVNMATFAEFVLLTSLKCHYLQFVCFYHHQHPAGPKKQFELSGDRETLTRTQPLQNDQYFLLHVEKILCISYS